jgi:hypothetical protein
MFKECRRLLRILEGLGRLQRMLEALHGMSMGLSPYRFYITGLLEVDLAYPHATCDLCWNRLMVLPATQAQPLPRHVM